MIRIDRFKAYDLKWITEQKGTAYLKPYLHEGWAKNLEQSEYAFTLRINDEVIGCAGVNIQWKNRGIAWALLSKDKPFQFLTLHRAVKNFLENAPIKRIEALVDEGFVEGHRWMKMLGFTLEIPSMEAFRPDGGNCALYSRVRHE